MTEQCQRDSQAGLLADSISVACSDPDDDRPPQINDMSCVDFEQRTVPRKDYVFVIEVTWTDGQKLRVRRNHNQLFRFQCRLLDAFPREAGQENRDDRIIPFLPGKKLFRGSTKSVARQRFPQIRDYVDKMKRLPYEILSSDMVRTFFSPHPEDLVRSRSVELDDKYGEDVGKRERSRTLPSEVGLPDSDDEEVFTGPAAVQNKFGLLTL